MTHTEAMKCWKDIEPDATELLRKMCAAELPEDEKQALGMLVASFFLGGAASIMQNTREDMRDMSRVELVKIVSKAIEDLLRQEDSRSIN